MKHQNRLIFCLFLFAFISCETEEIEEDPPFDFVRFEIDREEILLKSNLG